MEHEREPGVTRKYISFYCPICDKYWKLIAMDADKQEEEIRFLNCDKHGKVFQSGG